MFCFQETDEWFPQVGEGTIDEFDNSKLRVKALGSIWNAILDSSWGAAPLASGQKVQVIGRKGIRLIIAP